MIGMSRVENKKSVLLSGLLSFVFGPLGWLYAAPWKSGVIGAAVYLLVAAILPNFVLVYLLGVIAPLSAIAGVLYALGYNLAGERIPIFGREADKTRALGRGAPRS